MHMRPHRIYGEWRAPQTFKESNRKDREKYISLTSLLLSSFLATLLALPSMAASKGQSEDVNVDVYTAKGLLATGYRYLDVRSKEEFEKGHVEDALNIPYMFITEEGRVKNPEFLAQVSEVCKKADKLVVACNRGGRGLKATIDLRNEGYESVSNVEGGYSAWVDAGFAGKNAEKVACDCPS